MKFVRTPSSSVPAMEAARRYQLCSIRRICAFFASTALLVKRTKLGLGIDARSDMAAPQIIAATRTAIIKNIRVSENRVQAPDATMSMRKSIWCAKVSPSSRRNRERQNRRACPARLNPSCKRPGRRRLGSHVPYKSLVELRAAYMPDAAWAVSVHPPSLSRRKGQPPVLTSSNPISTLLQRFACARLSQPCLSESCSDFSATFTTIAFDNSSLRWLEINT
jgi:hypothetical protein